MVFVVGTGAVQIRPFYCLLKKDTTSTSDPAITFTIYTLRPNQMTKICQTTASPQCSYCLHFNAIICIVQLI